MTLANITVYKCQYYAVLAMSPQWLPLRNKGAPLTNRSMTTHRWRPRKDTVSEYEDTWENNEKTYVAGQGVLNCSRVSRIKNNT